MAEHKEALSSLCPISWDDLPPSSDLPTFLTTAFAHAERVLNSIPTITAPSDTPTTFTPAPANSAKKATDTLCDPSQIPLPAYPRDSDAVKGHGKPYKLGEKDNPLGVQVYKSAAHDRRGAWFSRRSVHQGLGFEKWRKCAEREFKESLKCQDGPGLGAVRGVSADRRVEHKVVEGFGTIDVWQTSSAFPAVTARESLTLVISSTTALSPLPNNTPAPRHFLLISRPTTHSAAPNRPKLVKMAYESAEMIREIPIPSNEDPESNPIEWLMITRSDPGGGIPKFMVERGTPGGISGDVGKFLDWACGRSDADLEDMDENEDEEKGKRLNPLAEKVEQEQKETTKDGAANGSSSHDQDATTAPTTSTSTTEDQDQTHDQPHPQTLASKLTTTAASYLPASLTSNPDANPSKTSLASTTHSTTSSTSSDSTISSASFHSTHSEHRQSLSISATAPASTGAASTAHTNKEIAKLFAKRAQLTQKYRQDRAAADAKTKEVAAQAEAARESLDAASVKSGSGSSIKDGKDSSSTSTKDGKDTNSKEAKEAAAQSAKEAKETAAREARDAKEVKEKEKLLARQEKDAKKRDERYQSQLAKIDVQRVKEEKKEAERTRKREEKNLGREVGRLRKELDEVRGRAERAEARLVEREKEEKEREAADVEKVKGEVEGRSG